jgi:two-component system nitrate/nitrite response regulator NarL
MMHPISVLLVGNDSTFLRLATRFLHECSDNEVVVIGAAGGGEGVLVKAQELRPQVILIDMNMPGLTNLEIIPLLRSTLPEVGIITMAMMDTNGYRQTALAAGANALVAKADLSTDLLPAIRKVAQAR